MSAKIIDGEAVAAEITAQVRADAAALAKAGRPACTATIPMSSPRSRRGAFFHKLLGHFQKRINGPSRNFEVHYH
mgnify:CR=1 FL=1